MGGDFIFHVPKIWYRIYWAGMTAFNILALAGFVVVHFEPSLAHFGQVFDLGSDTTMVLASIALVYLLGGYWLILRYDIAIATLVGAMFNALGLLNGINNASTIIGAIPFIAFWLLFTGLNGVFGLTIVLGTFLAASIDILISCNFHLSQVSTRDIAFFSCSLVVAAVTWLFWRKQFINPQDQRMSKLSGMLKSNQTQSAILIQSIADGVIVTNTDGQITLMNRAAANMTGWPVDEGIGTEVKLVVKVTKEDGSEIPEADFPFTAVLAHRVFINQTLQINSRSGKKLIVSLVISPVVTSAGEVYGAVGVLRDISEQRAAEKQSAEFISTASHEMRTPVAAIEGYLSLALNEKVSTIDTRARGFLEKAHASTQHLGQLFQDLLTSAKAEDGRLTNHPQVVEIGAFLQQLVEDLRFAAQKKSLAVEFVVGTNEAIDATKSDDEGRKVIKPLYYVYADPDRVREVITNLFDNATKYTESGKISIGLTGNNEVVQFYIRDTGAGIPAEDIPHLFQKFYRVDSSATRTIG